MPTLDLRRPHAKHVKYEQGVHYVQDGHMFNGSGTYIGPANGAKPIAPRTAVGRPEQPPLRPEQPPEPPPRPVSRPMTWDPPPEVVDAAQARRDALNELHWTHVKREADKLGIEYTDRLATIEAILAEEALP